MSMLIDAYRFGGSLPPSGGAYNPANKSSKITLSESNARMTLGASPTAWNMSACLNARSSGKRYAELQLASNHYGCVGVVPNTTTLTNDYATPDCSGVFTDGSCGVWTSARLYRGNGVYDNKNLITNTSGHVLGFMVDLDSGKIWLARNNTLLEGDPAAGTGASFTMTSLGAKFLLGGAYEDTASNRIRTKASEFAYTPPTGFIGWDD